MTTIDLLGTFLKILIVVGISQGVVAYLILVERKIAAWAQDRIGPNRAGLELLDRPGFRRLAPLLRPLIGLGLLHPIADGVKMFVKEDVVPGYVNRPLYLLAPVLAITMATIAFAVVPFGPVGATGANFLGFGDVQFQIAPGIDIGILYVFAIGSLAVYGVILAGYSSNNKYSFLGAMRSSAQLISYELPLGLSILGIILICRSLDLNAIIHWQDRHVWGILVQPLGFLLFLISAFAETNRLPFDLPESEQELVGGFHTEYSALKFGMFFLGEYLHVITASFLITILFLGGWDIPFLTDQAQTGWFWALVKVFALLLKVGLLIILIMWVRWTLPRFRYDQLMDLAWKRMIPLALLNLVATATIVQLVRG
ncbi:MAG: NADH-quinone oxidoreductase subunit H [Isosphaeraceae bacterium]|jgi:NADH-quinone oxidoreductase subunit H|nr:MAG: NADH-quinone oxidoreductase subunit H [Isosphaeraceae bacterium]